ncbi:class E sortase [Streptomyces sp. TRM70308]|uniref:class E sortase n=1 Tax=Streptomyces sp. TRM70308 TaxID=3131932 RepID=UPI003CFE7107
MPRAPSAPGPSPQAPSAPGPQSPASGQAGPEERQGSPWFRPPGRPAPAQGTAPSAPRGDGTPPPPDAAATRPLPVTPAPAPAPAPRPGAVPEPGPGPSPAPRPAAGHGPERGNEPRDEHGDQRGRETVALRQLTERNAAQGADAADEPPGEGRAARRRAAAKAARARRENVAVIASRSVGELFITCGVLLLLFVAYQLWWTNVQAGLEAGREASALEEKWASEEAAARRPDAFDPGEGFAKMYIPKLDVVVPVAEGIDKDTVLDRGLVGHYDAASGLKTAMPWDEEGNFAVAGHRNTHGEPFRYINRLEPGDPIVVETRDSYYVYEMTSVLPSTSPSNVGVVAPVPAESGFTEPGRYVTLTTCTPEFTSKYRLIVWGKMVEERPRSEGKPDALVG